MRIFFKKNRILPLSATSNNIEPQAIFEYFGVSQVEMNISDALRVYFEWLPKVYKKKFLTFDAGTVTYVKKLINIWQIHSMLSCVSVIDHRWRENVVRTKKWDTSPLASVSMMFLPYELYLHDHTSTYSIAKVMFRNQNYNTGQLRYLLW